MAKRLFTYLALVFAALTLRAQYADVTSYSFLRQDADTVVYYGSSREDFSTLYRKLGVMIKNGRRQVRMLHIGDSHLQADLFTGEVRKNFQSIDQGLTGARGMMTPYLKGGPDSYKLKFSSGWKTANLLSSSSDVSTGLWGTTAYTYSQDEYIDISLNGRNPIKYDFNTVRIYHSPLHEGDNIFLENLAYQKITHEKEGYTDFICSSWQENVRVRIARKSTDTFSLYGLYFDNGDAGVVYSVTGTNGATAAHYNRSGLFASQLSTLSLDCIIISLGTNDTYEAGGEETFENNLSALVRTIQSVQKDVPILLTTPLECWHHKRKPNPRMAKTVEIINSVARKYSCAVIDLYTAMGGSGSAQKLTRNNLMQKDMVHLTAKGYQLEGDLFYNAIWNEVEKTVFGSCGR